MCQTAQEGVNRSRPEPLLCCLEEQPMLVELVEVLS